MKKKLGTVEDHCVVCKKPFEKYMAGKKNHNHRISGRYLRPSWSLTCSRKCSREFIRNRKVYLKIQLTS